MLTEEDRNKIHAKCEVVIGRDGLGPKRSAEARQWLLGMIPSLLDDIKWLRVQIETQASNVRSFMRDLGAANRKYDALVEVVKTDDAKIVSLISQLREVEQKLAEAEESAGTDEEDEE